MACKMHKIEDLNIENLKKLFISLQKTTFFIKKKIHLYLILTDGFPMLFILLKNQNYLNFCSNFI
ncbi:hypothetical protein BpHYR1_050433 [Brachionus plicatilis]|uniref:Uncharacterized protein n=1 Tax=Brachionus plicatilis TaxID=10195 RepID=A0A3M7SZW5_BRAPC|nr:hypothetical protein BpHYR1_050433 [Brachionus plicatilis]